MKFCIYLFIILYIPLPTFSQSILLPSIGITSLPGDNDSTCYIPMFPGSFYTSGIQEGDTASDFKLYNLAGDSIILSEMLNAGKPVLLIAGSYTCPVFRNKVAGINNIVNLYGNQIEIAIIYTIEAHPIIDTSVYFGYVNTGSQNINEGILYRQPETYGERKDNVNDMLNNMTIAAPVYIDGPCNNWWNHYGPAPNNAYIIDTGGIVFAKHGWYNKFPDNIICDLDSLLGNPVNCSPGSSNGSFTFNLLSNDTMSGVPGSTITLTGELVNNSSQDVIVDVYRIINNLPLGWASSLCIDICYPTTTDSAEIYLTANTVLPFYFYIYTNGTIDTARTRVGFRNRNNPNNQFIRNLFGYTSLATSTHYDMFENSLFEVFPNPAQAGSDITLKFHLDNEKKIRSEVYNLSGSLISKTEYGWRKQGINRLLLGENITTSGMYFYHIFLDDSPVYTGKIFIAR